jgi:hypothetical protein
MRTRWLAITLLLASLWTVRDVRAEQKRTEAQESDVAARQEPVQKALVRPFPSKHQQRIVMEAVPPSQRGGQCLPNYICTCSYPGWDPEGWCNGSMQCYGTATIDQEDRNCRYVCNDPFQCQIITDAECEVANPCNP